MICYISDDLWIVTGINMYMHIHTYTFTCKFFAFREDGHVRKQELPTCLAK